VEAGKLDKVDHVLFPVADQQLGGWLQGHFLTFVFIIFC
jgi:hypothetical protein